MAERPGERRGRERHRGVRDDAEPPVAGRYENTAHRGDQRGHEHERHREAARRERPGGERAPTGVVARARVRSLRALQLARERPSDIEPARRGDDRHRERELVAERAEQRKQPDDHAAERHDREPHAHAPPRA